MAKFQKGDVRLTEGATTTSRNSATLWRRFGGVSTVALSLAMLMPAGMAFAQDASADKPAAASKEVEGVVVTGSRIVRRDYTSDSPIVTLSSQVLQQQADVEIQSTLNKLPQFSPDQNLLGANTGDVQPTPTHSLGISTASLRGLGSNRNLVLIDGRRGAPVNASLVIDLNTIPTAMIDHVETITGGASATYGADAIGGVVNFILKKNFRGADFDVQYGFNQAGDGRQFSASALFGTNFADDKGNITFEMERLSSDAVKAENHPFQRKGWADPNTATTSFFNYGTYMATTNAVTAGGFPAGTVVTNMRESGGPPSQAAVNSIFANPRDQILGTSTYTLGSPTTGPTGTFSVPTTSNFYVLGNNVYSGLGGTPSASYTVPFPLDGKEYAQYNCLDAAHGNALGTCVKSNATTALLQSPLDRYSFFTNGHYDFNDWLTANFQGSYSRTHTETLLTAPVSVIDGWNVFIPYDAATGGAASGHPVPTALQTLLNSRGPATDITYCLAGSVGCTGTKANPVTSTSLVVPTNDQSLVGKVAPYGRNAPWDMGWIPNLDGPLPARGAEGLNQVFQLTAGLQGKLPFNNTLTSDWTWNAFATHSESTEYTIARGDFSLQRLRALVLAPNWGQTAPGAFIGGVGNSTQASGTGQTIPTTNPGFGVATDTCTSGLYNLLFNNQAPSKDCLNAIAAPLQSMNITRQDQAEFDIQGSLFKLPAGTVKFAAGADYRRDQTIYNPDLLQSYDSFIDQVIGVYPVPYTNVAEDVKEGYGELDIPVLADLPFIKSFTLNPGVRYSTYSASKGGWTYKIMGDLAVNDWLRFRGGYNLAVRAPNLGELFLGKTQNFGGPGTSYGDACSLLSNAPWGAGGAAAPSNGAAGAPVVNSGGAAGAKSAYLICQAMMGANGVAQYYNDPSVAQANPAPSPFAFVNLEGNKDLIPEEAHTYTAGVVLRSPIQSDWLRGATMSIDYYKIHINHAIEYSTVDYVYQKCLQTTSVTDATSAAAWVASNPYCQGDTGVFRNATGGIGNTTTPQANLATIDTSGVDVTFDWRAPLSLVRKEIPGTLSLSFTGTFLGNYDTVNFPGASVSRWYGTLGPTLTGTNPGAYRYRLNTSVGYSIGPATFNLNWRNLPQVHAALPAGTPNVHTLDTSGYDVFDLNTFWNLPHGLQLRGGIQNLFDKAPPTTGATTPTINAAGVITTLAVSGTGTTNSSYYDINGRRFFIGLKARF